MGAPPPSPPFEATVMGRQQNSASASSHHILYRSFIIIIIIHRHTQDFTMEGVHVVGGRSRGSVPSGVQGKSPGRGSGDKVPQKLKQNMKLAYNF